MIGQGSIGFNNLFVRQPQPTPPFAGNSANNGLSVDPVTGQIVLGQNVGAVGDPAQLLSAREIPLKGFNFTLGEAGSSHLLIAPTALVYLLGDLNAVGNGTTFQITDASKAARITSGGAIYFNLQANAGVFEYGDVSGVGNGTVFTLNDTTQTAQINVAGNPYIGIDIPNDVFFIGDGFSGGAKTFVYVDPFIFSVKCANKLVLNANIGSLYEFGAIGFDNSSRIAVDDVARIVILDALNGIITVDPTTLATGHPWMLGMVKAGAVALDAANYIEVSVNGVIKKLLIAA
jgi:hypothetical protein